MDYKKSALVDEYIAGASAESQGMMKEIRNLIFEEAPKAEETMLQRMPSYALNGEQLAYFASGNNQIDFFTESKSTANNQKNPKGNRACNSDFHLKLNEPLPLDLMRESLAMKVGTIMQAAEKHERG